MTKNCIDKQELTAGNTFAFSCALYDKDSEEATPLNPEDFKEVLIGFYWGGTKKLLVRKPDYKIVDNRLVFTLDANQTRTMFGSCRMEAKLVSKNGEEINGGMEDPFFVRNLSISQEKI